MLDDLRAWYARPFSTDMNALQWFLFFGFILALAASWKIILNHIEA